MTGEDPRRGEAVSPHPTAAPGAARVLVLGGGFAGLYAATYLAAAHLPEGAAEVTLVSDSNHFTFTPLLAEVLGGSLGVEHVTVAYRALARRYGFRFLLARVEGLDPERRIVSTGSGELSYDFAIIALGASPQAGTEAARAATHLLAGVEDAMAIRGRLIGRAERAAQARDSRERRRMLTFVVTGAGPAGVEAAGEIHNLLTEHIPRFYDVGGAGQVVLVESGDRILRGWDDRLADEGLQEMRRRGVDVRLGTRVRSFRGGVVQLEGRGGAKSLEADTLVWTAGSVPATAPLRAGSLPLTSSGHLPVDRYLRVEGRTDLFAAGDMTHRLNPRTGEPYPAVAPIAISQGIRAAANVENLVAGREPEEYRAHHAGKIVSLGRGVALVDLLGFRITGRPAWAIYRAAYLLKLVGLQNKARAATTLALNSVFGRNLSSVS
jgi:NADH dehydrogenase